MGKKERKKKAAVRDRVGEAVAEYERLRPTYERFRKQLAELLPALLSNANISVQSVETRTKDMASFKQKIERPGKSYEKPLEEVTDLCGVRILAYYVEDVASITDLIRDEFQVDAALSVDKADSLKAHEVGYQSVHMIVSLSEQRGHLSEWRGFAGLKAEIQVRTILQHAWAAISHALQYKHEEEVPRKLRRRLYLLSGLLELADHEFADLHNAHKTLVEELEKSSVGELGGEEVSRASLLAFLARSPLVQDLLRIDEAAGFDVHPNVYGAGPEELSDLARCCAHLGIRTLREVEAGVQQALPLMPDFLRAVYMAPEPDTNWYTTPPVTVNVALLVSRLASAEAKSWIEREMGSYLPARILEYAKKLKARE